ncbi:unnamed protein product [Timema podura]|uniref:Uncharacterized protein n=1 Tax=Timema podura TaxID=61482 RepID=A0ABN7P2R7_TIMPD|nr:unnamed protein product [Timema podura]
MAISMAKVHVSDPVHPEPPVSEEVYAFPAEIGAPCPFYEGLDTALDRLLVSNLCILKTSWRLVWVSSARGDSSNVDNAIRALTYEIRPNENRAVTITVYGTI